MVRALILAAGFGSRLRPLTESIPKPLISIGHESILERMLRQLWETKLVDAVYVNVSYRAQDILSFIGTLPKERRPTLVWENRPLGTAHTVYQIQTAVDGPLLVIHGDLVVEADDLKHFVASCLTENCSIVATHLRPRSRARSVLELNGERVVRLVEVADIERVQSEELVRVNSGIYWLQSTALQSEPTQFLGRNISPAILQTLIDTASLSAFSWKGQRVSVESPSDLKAAIQLAVRTN